MGGAKDFIIGGLAIGLSFAITGLSGGTLAFLAGPLFAYGVGRVIGRLSQIFLGMEQRVEGAKFNVRTTQAPVPVIYGRSRVGLRMNDMRIINANDVAVTPNADPSVIFPTGGGEDGDDPADNNDILVKVGAVALGSTDGSGIQLIDNVRVYQDDRTVIPTMNAGFNAAPSSAGVDTDFSAHLKYHIRAGTDAQGAPEQQLQDQLGWGTDFRGAGVAYAAFYSFYNTDTWMQGIPQYTMRVTGCRVYDPRSAAYINFTEADVPSSDNPALCILDYLTSKRFGGGVPYAARDGGSDDFIDEQSFIDAANYCDDLVSIEPSGTEKRFRMNAVIDTGQVVGNNLAEMMTACRGQLIWQNGLYRLVINQVTTPETFELTEDNIVGAIEWTRKGASIPNYMECAFNDDRDTDYKANTVTWPLVGDTTFLDEDNGQENRAEMTLPYTTTYCQAQRTIMVMLREARNDVFVNLQATQAAYVLQVGNVVKVTHEGPGWDQLEFTVMQMNLTPDGLVGLSLQQYTDAAYNLDTLDAQPSVVTTNLPDPTSIDPPTALVLTADETTTLRTQDGQAVPRIRVDWTPPVDPYLSHYECQFFETGTPGDVEAIANPQRFDDNIFIWPVTEAVDYTIQIRSVNSLGVKSAFVTDAITVVSEGQPQFSLSATLDVSQSGVLEADGNAGVASYRIAFVKGFGTLTPPSDATVQAADFVDGQILSIEDVSAAYPDIPVALSQGEGVVFKAFAYSLVGGVGNESELPVTAFVTRFVDLVFLNLNAGIYTIQEDELLHNADIVNDLSEGNFRIEDAVVGGSALAVTGPGMDEIIILSTGDVA